MAKGSQLTRALAFFREGNLDEARVAYTLAGEIVAARLEKAVKEANAQSSAADRSRPKRTRRAIVTTVEQSEGEGRVKPL